jgi:hypothetical protein
MVNLNGNFSKRIPGWAVALTLAVIGGAVAWGQSQTKIDGLEQQDVEQNKKIDSIAGEHSDLLATQARIDERTLHMQGEQEQNRRLLERILDRLEGHSNQ